MAKKVPGLTLLAALVLAAAAACFAEDEAVHGTGLMLHERQREPFAVKLPRSLVPLPARFDWRDEGKVTPVKDQGSCGACYAFSALADFESKILISGGPAFDFSENNVKECEFYHRRCSGGTYWFVTNYLSTWGTVMEECDRYQSSMTGCRDTCPAIKTLLDWRAISEGWIASTEAIKTCLINYGPVFVGLYAGYGDAWQQEFSNYDGSYTLNYTGGAKYANHAGLIVGWDDSLEYVGGKGAWIIKNSWGTDWGGPCGYGDERGYYTLAYRSAQVGQAASFLGEWQDYDPDGRLYYFDEGGYTKGLGYGASTTAWGMCLITPDVDVTLQRVEFWSFDPVSDADIYLYNDFDGTTLAGLRAQRLNYASDFMGYHSVELPSEIVISAGDTVCVAIKITAESDTMPVPIDRYGTRAPGHCFASPDGVTWSEVTNGDVGVRLRATKFVDIIPPSLELGIEQPDSVPDGMDVYVTASEQIDPASLDVRVGSHRVEMEQAGGEPNAYRGRYLFTVGGVLEVNAEARDLAGNPGSASVDVKVSLLDAAEGGSAASEGDGLEVRIGRGVLGEDAYILVAELPVVIPDLISTYRVTPAGTGLGDFVEVSIAYGDAAAPESLCVVRLAGDQPVRLKSYVDSEHRRLVAYSESLGTFGVSRSGGAPSTPLGAGRLRLAQNYPNPFSSTSVGTTIVFELPAAGPVGIRVYTVEGRLVRELLDGDVPRGAHRIEWDGRDSRGNRVASGVYYLRAESGLGKATRKMVIAN